MPARTHLALLCLALPALSPAHAQTAWVPTRSVEMVIPVAPGGGIDRTARMIQKIVQDRRLIGQPVNVVNKPGGGGTIAQAYLNMHAGDAHYYEITSTSLLTNHIIGRSTATHRDFSPLAMLFDEYLGFAVAADSPIKDGKQLLEVLRNRMESLPIGIATSAGNTNHIGAGIIAKHAGGDVKKLKVVVFSSGGESMTALLGGHVGLVVTPSANLISHLQNGRMRVLAVSAPKRLVGALGAVPTWREQGVDAVVANWRPVIGPKGLSSTQIAYWESVFATLAKTDEWTREIERTGAISNYLGSRELTAHFDQQYMEFRGILTDLGLAK